MAEKPQAIAVKTNKVTAAGPPLKLAVPIVLKIPAPIMAAIPMAVRSLNPSVLVSRLPLFSAKSWSATISLMVFLLKSCFNANGRLGVVIEGCVQYNR